MEIRFWIDRQTGEPHILRHGVSQDGAIEVLSRPMQELAGRDGAIICLGQTVAGRYLGIVHVPDSGRESIFVITGYELGPKAIKALRRHLKRKKR